MPVRSILSMIVQVAGPIPRAETNYNPLHSMIVDSTDAVREENAVIVTRPGKNFPQGWEPIYLSSTPEFIDPRELAKLLHVLIEKLQESPNRAVVLECPEYLALYNGFESMLKFLHSLRDHVMLLGGRLYVITEPSAWDERQYALLKRIEL